MDRCLCILMQGGVSRRSIIRPGKPLTEAQPYRAIRYMIQLSKIAEPTKSRKQ
jgi:hypothetical protein